MRNIYYMCFIICNIFTTNAQDLMVENDILNLNLPNLTKKMNESEPEVKVMEISNFHPDSVSVANCQYSDPNYFLMDVSYATVPKISQNIWSLRNINTRSCFKIDQYTTPCFEYSSGDSDFQLTARVYKKKYFNPADEIFAGLRPAIIFVRGGGYHQNSGGLRSNNPANLSADDVLCKNLAEQGFVVFNIDYRKGWDAQRYYPYKKIIPGSNTQLAPNTCECEVADSCKSFTFLQATYRMAQDVRAAHRKILEIGEQFNIDKNYIFYAGGSTGAIAVMSTAYGFDNLPEVKEYPSNSTSRTLQSTCGSIDNIGVGLPSGHTMNVSGIYALQAAMPYDINFIENSDPVEILGLSHGTADTPVNYCENTLLSGLFGAGPNGNKDQLDDNHINLFGTGSIYNRYKTLTNKYASILELPGVEHELNVHGVPAKRMKCYESTPFTPACNVLKFSFNNAEIVQGANVVYNALIKPLVLGTLYEYYVNGSTEPTYFRIGNVLNCSTCNITQITNPTVCGISHSGNRIRLGDNVEEAMKIYPSDEKNKKYLNLFDETYPNLFDEKIKIYPNPSNNQLNIDINRNYDYGMISLFNLNGDLLKNITINSNNVQLNVGSLPAGEYILYIMTDENISSSKFIKQ